jgi:hypothetical protein
VLTNTSPRLFSHLCCVNNLFIKIIPFQLAGTIYGPYSYIEEIHPGMKNNKHVLGKAQEPHLPRTWDDDRPFGMKYKKGELTHNLENGCILIFIVDLFSCKVCLLVLIGQSLPPVTTSIYKIRKMIKNERSVVHYFSSS